MNAIQKRRKKLRLIDVSPRQADFPLFELLPISKSQNAKNSGRSKQKIKKTRDKSEQIGWASGLVIVHLRPPNFNRNMYYLRLVESKSVPTRVSLRSKFRTGPGGGGRFRGVETGSAPRNETPNGPDGISLRSSLRSSSPLDITPGLTVRPSRTAAADRPTRSRARAVAAAAAAGATGCTRTRTHTHTRTHAHKHTKTRARGKRHCRRRRGRLTRVQSVCAARVVRDYRRRRRRRRRPPACVLFAPVSRPVRLGLSPSQLFFSGHVYRRRTFRAFLVFGVYFSFGLKKNFFFPKIKRRPYAQFHRPADSSPPFFLPYRPGPVAFCPTVRTSHSTSSARGRSPADVALSPLPCMDYVETAV